MFRANFAGLHRVVVFKFRLQIDFCPSTAAALDAVAATASSNSSVLPPPRSATTMSSLQLFSPQRGHHRTVKHPSLCSGWGSNHSLGMRKANEFRVSDFLFRCSDAVCVFRSVPGLLKTRCVFQTAVRSLFTQNTFAFSRITAPSMVVPSKPFSFFKLSCVTKSRPNRETCLPTRTVCRSRGVIVDDGRQRSSKGE